ncbi:hypothetical protein TMU3MR103_0789 [Tetragenococcus muriaticus 3MR10-3]|uniref:Uncharacterized protein n=1 Tax=Tetragenococcus muriaticus 3MR10-3 TaxID=1302648 RepID=A0A091C280_9ENTE|nr:hypothetical protein TMU3MR103_0789 [Tetragenococcus muriaticus 3MR10-3]
MGNSKTGESRCFNSFYFFCSKKIDLENQKAYVEIPEGLLDDEN